MQAQRHRQLEADLKNKRAELGKLAKQRHEEVKGKVANWKAHKMAELEATKTQKQLEEQKEKEFRYLSSTLEPILILSRTDFQSNTSKETDEAVSF